MLGLRVRKHPRIPGLESPKRPPIRRELNEPHTVIDNRHDGRAYDAILVTPTSRRQRTKEGT